MNEQEAIPRVAQGEPISCVCADLSRTRAWYSKWRARYAQEGLAGLQDQRPGHPSPRTPDGLRDLIVETRDRLVRQAEAGAHHLGIGADEIAKELQALGVAPPSRRTIYYILQAAGRTAKEESPKGYRQRPPAEGARMCIHWTSGPGCWKAAHRSFSSTWWMWLPGTPVGGSARTRRPITSWTSCRPVGNIWGCPAFSVENEMSFTGGRWASRLGRLVRFALLLGCEVSCRSAMPPLSASTACVTSFSGRAIALPVRRTSLSHPGSSCRAFGKSIPRVPGGTDAEPCQIIGWPLSPRV